MDIDIACSIALIFLLGVLVALAGTMALDWYNDKADSVKLENCVQTGRDPLRHPGQE